MSMSRRVGLAGVILGLALWACSSSRVSTPPPPAPLPSTDAAPASPLVPSVASSSAVTTTSVPAPSASGAEASRPVWADVPPAELPSPTVSIPTGAFVMGCSASAKVPCSDDEEPAHLVLTSAFEIDVHEVTVAQFVACVRSGACGYVPPADEDLASRCRSQLDPARARQPMRCITWLDAHRYCRWRGKRLPTEAEWERAARGSDRRAFPWGELSPTEGRACFGGEGPCAVGSHSAGASAFGVMDMAGNVAEFVWDRYHPEYYRMSPRRDPRGFEGLLPVRFQRCQDSSCVITRGGHWASTEDELRATARQILPAFPSKQRSPRVGFRCVKSAVDLRLPGEG